MTGGYGSGTQVKPLVLTGSVFSGAADTIRARFESTWPILRPHSPVLWPNDRLNPAPDPNEPENGQAGWVSFELTSGVERLAAFGGYQENRWRQSGEVVIRCFAPVTGGETIIRGMAADACSIFRGWQSGNIKFFEASTTGGDISEDGNWYELDVLCSFFFDLIG